MPAATVGGGKRTGRKTRLSLREAFSRLKQLTATDWARAFALSAGGLLLFAALSALADFPLRPTAVHTPFDVKDPIFGVSAKTILLLEVVLQLVGAWLCLFTKRTAGALLFVAWLALNFLVYRVGLLTKGWPHPVFGWFYLTGGFGFSPRTADALVLGAVVYLFAGSVVALWVLRRARIAAGFLKAFCPACGGHVKFPIQNLGGQIACPHCRATMTLSSPGETLKMSCVLCGGHVEFPAYSVGRKIACPHCRKTITLLHPERAKRSAVPPPSEAFTLLELLIVVGIIAVLAALLLPVLSRAKEKAREATCQSNLHQIAIGFQLYWQDNHDEFPAPGSKTEYGPQPEDWIWWEQDRDVTRSAIARYVSGFNPKVFTCPSDRDAQRLQGEGRLRDDPYRYSYSLTSYSLTPDKVNPGMSTLITPARKAYPFKSSQIRHPSAKIMLVEEDRRTLNDSRWLPVAYADTPNPEYNLIASRHGQQGNVVFADSHIRAEQPVFGRDPTNSVPGY